MVEPTLNPVEMISLSMFSWLGDGLGSRERESGVTRPEAMPECELGDDGAERDATFRFESETTQPVFGRCLLRLKDCSINLASDCGSIRQKEPFPGSDCERATLRK